jgi:polysaccharide pyruvyl transferase WcaK-like protein
MPTALIVGAFGQRNPGDEALGQAFSAGLGGWEPVMTTSDPTSTRATHGCDAVSVWDAPAVARRALAADAVVIAGGTVFKVLHPASGRPPLALLSRAVALTAAARARGKPRAAIGVGAGPLRGSAAPLLARMLVRQNNLLILRDEESAEVLHAARARSPFRVGADPAWTLLDPMAKGRPVANGRPTGETVVVALSFLAGGVGLPDYLAAALVPLIEAGIDVRLQPWQLRDGRIDDLRLAQAVAERLGAPVEILDPPADLADAVRAFAGCRIVVGLRFHALMAAAAAGVPFVALAHEPKLAGLARRLSQPAVDPTATPAALSDAILGALRHAPPSREAVQGQIAAAEESFRLLRLLLTEGASPEAEEIAGLPLRPAAREAATRGALGDVDGDRPS